MEEVQDLGDGACRDAHASGAPVRASTLLTTQPQNLVLDLEWRPVRVMMRGAGTIHEPSLATFSVSVQPPMSALTRNPHRFHRMNHSPSLNSDTVDQQQPAMNSQTGLGVGHEGLRLIGVSFDTPHPTQRSSLSAPPGVTHVPAKYI